MIILTESSFNFSEMKIEVVLENLTTRHLDILTGHWTGEMWRPYFTRLPPGLHKVRLVATGAAHVSSGMAVDDFMIMSCSHIGRRSYKSSISITLYL